MNALSSTIAVNRAERKQKDRHKRISHSVINPFFLRHFRVIIVPLRTQDPGDVADI
jgi:hypothetical protein